MLDVGTNEGKSSYIQYNMAVKNRVVLNLQQMVKLHHSTKGAGKTGHQYAKKTEGLNSNNARKNLDLYLELHTKMK